MSKSKQVLELTNKGLKAEDIAKKLKTSVAYVYFVRSTAKKITVSARIGAHDRRRRYWSIEICRRGILTPTLNRFELSV